MCDKINIIAKKYKGPTPLNLKPLSTEPKIYDYFWTNKRKVG